MEWAIGSVAAAAGVQGDAPMAGAMHAAAGRDVPANDAFASLMRSGLGELNASVGAAEGAMRDLAAGKAVELHEVMISMERARISVQTFVQVRNKLVESYQDLTRMQL